AALYSTYLGGDTLDDGRAVAVDSSGRAHVTGRTFSANFPTAGPRQTALNSFGPDLFVSRLDAAGSALDYSVFHGGSSSDEGLAIALDPAGNAYVTGSAGAFDFPAVNPVQAGAGGEDAFVLKLGPTSNVIYSTPLGGFGSDRGTGIAADASGAAYVVGRTTSSNFPVVAPLKATNSGGTEAFVAKIAPSVDLAVAIADAPDPVLLGNNLTYTVTVTNAGELPATGVRLTHTPPAAAAFVSAAASQGACGGTGPVVCELGSLAGGASATVTVVVTAPAVRTLTATAAVAANEAEVITANNTDSETTLVDFADLAASAAALRDPVPAGGRLTYLFGVSNLAGANAPNVVLNVALPAGVTFVSCSSEGGVCGGAGDARTVTFASLAVGAARSALVTVEVNAGAADDTTLTASASVSSALPDPAAANNAASAAASVAANVVRPKGNGKLAFSLFNDGLYVINEDGTGETRIVAGPRIFAPAWSPDGTRIAFVSQHPDNFTSELRVANADGSEARTLATSVANDTPPTWSPNGAAIAFIRERTGIKVVNTIGPPVVGDLARNLPSIQSVDWSPDGTKLLYWTSTADIGTVNADGTGQTFLNNDPAFFDSDPVWSPDGSKIMFLRRLNGQSGETIYEMNADGSNPRTLPNSRSGRRPIYSPDGQKIAFGAGGLFTMLADGTNLQQVSSKADAFSMVSWQPLPGATPPPPPPPTFRIAGRISFPASHAQLASFTIRLAGTRTATTGVDAEGNYSFTVPAGSYTVTPEPNLFLSVSPQSRAVNVVDADQTGVDFTATPIIYSVSGHVRRPDGTPIPGIEISLNGSIGGFRTTVTAADGSYSFINLFPHASYSIFVSLSSRVNFDFEPDAVAFGVVEPSRVVNFVGTPARRFQIGARYIVGEGDGRVRATVTRTGDASATASVSYRTVDGSTLLIPCADASQGAAFARCDYATSVDTLVFAPGETAKTFDIPVIDDAHVEGSENFTAVLLNPSENWNLGQTSSAFITIEDNDGGAAQQNPIERSTFFVRQHYLDFLSREPEPGEPWTGVLDRCPNVNNQDPLAPSAGCDRLLVSQSFFQSPEFYLKGFYAYLYYRVAYDRRPFYEEITPDMRSLAGATPPEVFARRADYAAAFTRRGDFVMRYGLVSSQHYVDALLGRYGVQQITTENPQDFEGTAQVTLTRQQLIDALDNNTLTKAQVLRAVVQSNEVDAAEYHGAFVSMQYYGYLRRTPEQSGYDAWLRVIKQDPNNIRQMVNGFMNSQEYRLRFGQP
ncbi:MAG TPA: SBBP repeat-containing protein, partial [Pyrinomonadaceae bacterium]